MVHICAKRRNYSSTDRFKHDLYRERKVQMELSEDDLALIQVLQASPRIAWADAAKVLDVHATTLAARWDRLTSQGAAWATAQLAAVPEIVTVEEAASNRDLMLTVITRSLEEFSERVVSHLKTIDGLTKYQVALCTRLHSSGDDWRLNVLSRSQLATLRTLGPPASLEPAQVAGQLPQSHLDLLPFLARDGR